MYNGESFIRGKDKYFSGDIHWSDAFNNQVFDNPTSGYVVVCLSGVKPESSQYLLSENVGYYVLRKALKELFPEAEEEISFAETSTGSSGTSRHISEAEMESKRNLQFSLIRKQDNLIHSNYNLDGVFFMAIKAKRFDVSEVDQIHLTKQPRKMYRASAGN